MDETDYCDCFERRQFFLDEGIGEEKILRNKTCLKRRFSKERKHDAHDWSQSRRCRIDN